MVLRPAVLSAAVLLGATVAAHSAPVQWTVGSGGNDHWYEFVTSSTFSDWNAASTAASAMSHMGMTGYLATITSSAEQAFLNSLWPGSGSFWLGGTDVASEGNWVWATEPGGPIAFTYTNWAGGEPNNCCGGEHHLMGWWGGGGSWNDIYLGYALFGYVVEYDRRTGTDPGPSPIPLPAGAALLALGLAGLGAVARRCATA